MSDTSGASVRYAIRYRCDFRYDDTVAESQNELRICPSSDARQTVVHAAVHTTPSARVLTTEDYWGTRVDAFGVRAPHGALTVEMTAVVDVKEPPVVQAEVPLAELADESFRDAHREELAASDMAVATDEVAALAKAAAEGVTTVVGLGEALSASVEAHVEHETGVTEVGTSVTEVLHAGRGVCQDRAHLLVAMARTLGLPARYVSGYLCAGPTGSDTTTHAWVEIAVPGQGWHTLDPSDGGLDDQRRVIIGRGRDYADVAPLRGTYVGSDEHRCDVAVDISEVTPVGRG